ncbi:sacsin N-terminal ATP-binding-like domain-containing protein [Cupriavidus sp. a3]|uniref:sacsin N-terminal ATP-binding-like domain-containing protein n=1 Tax=Cupriavidus sp. a3 TaxID=3242158 RepID=UPI003D9C4284
MTDSSVIQLALVNDAPASPPVGGGPFQSPAEQLKSTLTAQLRNTVDAVRSGLLTYESLRNVSEVIGGEYGDRVIYELVQNAHDAHEDGEEGSILLKLVIRGADSGDLFIANKGKGFSWKNVNAIRNIGVSSKSVGEGIGNKGLGFRSVETLCDDPRIYSQEQAVAAEEFTGFCFRFAGPDEVRTMTLEIADVATADHVAKVLPRYLAAMPLHSQTEEIKEFARGGFATVVHLPLAGPAAVKVAREQVSALADLDAPLLLFLDRLARVAIEIDDSGTARRRTLTRSAQSGLLPDADSTLRCEIVAIGPGSRRYIVARRSVDRARLSAAVEASIAKEPQLARWREWHGEPSVAVAIALSASDTERGRTYNFLPMATEVPSRIRGHVDAPFYASIDRRRANFDLPLNSFLLDELAETALRAATELKPRAHEIGRNTIFDLAAWAPDDVQRLARASQRVGVDWRDCALVPAAGSDNSWATFRKSRIWHEQGYKMLRVRRLVKAGISSLADPRLEGPRLDRLRLLMEAVHLHPMPDDAVLADWIQSVALSLQEDGSGLNTWGSLYNDARKALAPTNSLRQLSGKKILRTREGRIEPAGGAGGAPVFVREAGPRDRDRAPLPSSAVASKIAILDDGIPMAAEVVADFIKAGLVRRYDAIQVLHSMHSLFGEKPAPKRREALLKWAFDVWRAEGPKSEKILREVDLHVETRSGWRPASTARFSEGWTNAGWRLATYLAEAAPRSPDCAQAAELLLAPEPSWAPKSEGNARRQWIDFLRAAGVRDGLPLLDDEGASTTGTPSWTWDRFRGTVVVAKGRSAAWTAANSAIHLPNPQTTYTRRGGLWRVPGQVEHETFPPETRQRLAELLLVQFASDDQKWLKWRLGRYDRGQGEQNERELPTPAAVFIAHAPWMPVEGDPERFERPTVLWATKDRRQRPPRYVDRPRERLVDLIDDEKRLAGVMFGSLVGLRDWSATGEVVRKLGDLAKGSNVVEPRERVSFRKIYQRAWAEACEAGATLPADLPVATVTSVGVSVVTGNKSEPTRVFVTGDSLRAETKAIIAAGQPVLELGEEDLVEPALELLRGSGGFDPLGIDRNQVDVLVDGEPMVASLADPLLASDGLEWLPEAAVLANELLGRELERQISSSAVDQRLRRVRLRYCVNISLAVAGKPVDEALPFFALPDDDHPTLVVGNGQELTWSVLADAAPFLSTLLDRRMRSLEMLMLRLAHRSVTQDPREPPTEDELARALGCKVELIREHALALRADGDMLIRRLLPVVACATDLQTAQNLGTELGDSPLRSKVLEALASIADRLPLPPHELLDVLARPDLAEIRRTLGLDYGRMNQMLSALGQPILSNEGELRRLFETWKAELSPAAVDRLRRHFWSSFDGGFPLDRYVSLRTLDFLEFQEGWVIDREELSRDDVATLLEARLAELVGDDVERELELLTPLRSRSKRTLQRFIDEVAPTVGAWCFRNEQPNPWADGALAVLKSVDQQGLLDFAPVEGGQEIATLSRAGRWPHGMPHTVDPVALGLDPEDLLGEKKREDERREQAELAKRTITFADRPLDTRSKEFAQNLIVLADAQMADGAWLTRSRRRFNLAEQAISDKGGGGTGGQGGKRRRTERVSEDLKWAMGFASEYLASRFLREKHKGHYNDRCWVSENRGRLEIDWEGDDSLGFDFRLQTVETEWRYEVKSNLDDAFEFEFTQNEMRSAAECAADGNRKYRILYVPFAFDPARWRVMELPNPMTERGRRLFKTIGTGATRLRFEPS